MIENFLLLLNQLEESTIEGKYKWNDSFINFIKENQFIEKITIKTEDKLYKYTDKFRRQFKTYGCVARFTKN